MQTSNDTILALDVGGARIGLARASSLTRLAQPFGALRHGASIHEQLRRVCAEQHVSHIVIGLPRGLNGQDTQQTRVVRAFGAMVQDELGLPISWQDEAVTSRQAEAELRSRGKPYKKEDIDALAATYILEDYLR